MLVTIFGNTNVYVWLLKFIVCLAFYRLEPSLYLHRHSIIIVIWMVCFVDCLGPKLFCTLILIRKKIWCSWSQPCYSSHYHKTQFISWCIINLVWGKTNYTVHVVGIPSVFWNFVVIAIEFWIFPPQPRHPKWLQ